MACALGEDATIGLGYAHIDGALTGRRRDVLHDGEVYHKLDDVLHAIGSLTLLVARLDAYACSIKL